MILNPSIRAVGSANFFPSRSVIVPMRNGTSSMSLRFAQRRETEKFLVIPRKSDTTRRLRGIHGARIEARIERTQIP